MSILPFGAAAASEYGDLRAYLQRQGTPIGPLDMLIAAHARAENMTLVTNNVREFVRVPDLEIENWA
ncbi:PIN domain-containing protein, partial [Acinetobacter pittii]|uniref:PIN domain-containing protein n=1 Tax=Acinetobacter pittii TaxID=48296 RepID=UPI0035C02F0C